MLLPQQMLVLWSTAEHTVSSHSFCDFLKPTAGNHFTPPIGQVCGGVEEGWDLNFSLKLYFCHSSHNYRLHIWCATQWMPFRKVRRHLHLHEYCVAPLSRFLPHLRVWPFGAATNTPASRHVRNTPCTNDFWIKKLFSLLYNAKKKKKKTCKSLYLWSCNQQMFGIKRLQSWLFNSLVNNWLIHCFITSRVTTCLPSQPFLFDWTFYVMCIFACHKAPVEPQRQDKVYILSWQ